MKDPKEPKKKGQGNRIKNYARYSGIAFQMIAIIVLGTYGGVKLDESYPNKYSLFTVICSLVAVALSMYYAVTQVTGFSKNDPEDDK